MRRLELLCFIAPTFLVKGPGAGLLVVVVVSWLSAGRGSGVAVRLVLRRLCR
ncbi:MAG TPA: hypothetical protein VE287_03815 [Actinopolymorphaceae bacterium]|nr:hypothetical protein [Actinopolymorphaceae bacterium]